MLSKVKKHIEETQAIKKYTRRRQKKRVVQNAREVLLPCRRRGSWKRKKAGDRTDICAS